jgi:hypothetical protein
LIKTLSIEDPLTANRRLLGTQSGGILTHDDQVSLFYMVTTNSSSAKGFGGFLGLTVMLPKYG